MTSPRELLAALRQVVAALDRPELEAGAGPDAVAADREVPFQPPGVGTAGPAVATSADFIFSEPPERIDWEARHEAEVRAMEAHLKLGTIESVRERARPGPGPDDFSLWESDF